MKTPIRNGSIKQREMMVGSNHFDFILIKDSTSEIKMYESENKRLSVVMDSLSKEHNAQESCIYFESI